MQIQRIFATVLKRKWFAIGLAVALSLIAISSTSLKVTAASGRKIPVKAVVVTMFEIGNDTGDTPGGFQFWVEREKLDKVYPLPGAFHELRSNSKGLISDGFEYVLAWRNLNWLG